jgi:hypothetical protein
VFHKRLRSLVRLAKCVGGAKKEILRRSGRPSHGDAFRLDRARLGIRPLGFDAAADRAAETFALFEDVARGDPPNCSPAQSRRSGCRRVTGSAGFGPRPRPGWPGCGSGPPPAEINEK